MTLNEESVVRCLELERKGSGEENLTFRNYPCIGESQARAQLLMPYEVIPSKK
jgi:hypothetical protein